MAPVLNLCFYERSSRSRSRTRSRHRARSSGRRRSYRSRERRQRQQSITDREASYDNYTPYPPVEWTSHVLAFQDVMHPPGDFTGPYHQAVVAGASVNVGYASSLAPMAGSANADTSTFVTSATANTVPPPPSPPPLPPLPTPPPGYHTVPPPSPFFNTTLHHPLFHLDRPPPVPFLPLPNQPVPITTLDAPTTDGTTPKTASASPFSKAGSQLTGFFSWHAQRAGAIVAVRPPESSAVVVSDSSAVLDDLTDANTGKPSSSYPEQRPGESNLAYSIRVADSISLNYEWAPIGSVPQPQRSLCAL